MPVITMYADASFCPHTKAAGGSYRITCNGEIMCDRFPWRGLKDSWESEVMTYGRAIQSIMKHPRFKNYLREGTTIVAVLDCEGVSTFANSDKTHSIKGRKFPASAISVRELHKLLILYTDVKIVFEHVKAHTNDTTVAAYFNSEVDFHAKAVMLDERKRIMKQGKKSK